jgi:FkbM family methyltransferase
MTVRTRTGAALRLTRATSRRASRIARHPSSAPVQLALAALEAAPPFVRGTSDLVGFPLTYTHPQSFAVQFESLFQREDYAIRSPDQAPIIFDCGANIGLATIYWLGRFPRARITCFEPDPTIAGVLRDNLLAAQRALRLPAGEPTPDAVTSDGVFSAVVGTTRVIEAAVWVEEGSLSFTEQGAGGGHLGGGALTVPTVRLADYLAAHRASSSHPIDLLKIDIEGAEVDVLLDCEPHLADVAALFVEFHSIVGRPQRLSELTGALERAGFRLAIETEFTSVHPFLALDAHAAMDMQLNIYAHRSEPT